MSAATTAATSDAAGNTWGEELTDVVRAMSGGLLFGVPLLYTMEVWWTGSHTSPTQVAVVLALLVVPVLALNRTAGFRSTKDISLAEAGEDTIKAVAIGLVVTAAVLVVLREVTLDTPIEVTLGKVVYEAVPFCLGIGVARHFLAGGRDGSGEGDGGRESGGADRTDDGLHPTLTDLGATTIGALFIALSIAPTDEIPMLASAMSPLWLLVVMTTSLGASYAIVFVAGFSDQAGRHAQEGIFQRPLSETIFSYLVALVVAAVLLWLFQRGVEPWTDVLARVIVLGLPAAVGGAAGRLAT
jgi:putative integral membrane protein (TIGR02587 family)